MNSRRLLKGAGCGVLLTLWYVRESLGPSHFIVYFHRLPLESVFLGVLADLVTVSLLAALAWAGLERLNRSNLLWPILVLGILLLEGHSAAYLYDRELGDFSRQLWIAFGAILAVTVFGLRFQSPRWFDRALTGVEWSLGFWGFSIVVLIPQLLYMAAQTSGKESVAFSSSMSQNAAGPRICWILFDELSYYQAYEHRAPGLKLPNFDRLSADSTVFNDVQPAGDYTDVAIPSMFLGRPVMQVRSTVSGTLLVTADGKKWEPFDASRTVFADARRLGWTTGIVGWANPYCRLMAGWVDDCYWLPEDDPVIRETNMDPSFSVAGNAATMPLEWLHTLVPTGVSDGKEYNLNWARRRERNFHLAMEHGEALIAKGSLRFQFIHLPVPHPPAIYNRKTRSFTAGGSYLDNLALADLALGELLDHLEKSPEWAETSLVVSGDHSFRPFVWHRLHVWTPEDEAASKGVYDRRPVLTIHLPGQRTGAVIGSKFPATKLSEVLGEIMRGQLHDSEDLKSSIGLPVVSQALKTRIKSN